MKKYCLIAMMVWFALNAFGQFTIKQDNARKNENSFFLAQKSFTEWSKEKNLDEEKGWKQFKRWEEYNSQRLNPVGELPSNKLILEQANKYNRLKQLKSAETDLWVPVGPDSIPSKMQSTIIGVGRINCIAFHPTDKNTFWVGVGQGGIWKTINSGKSWMPINNNLPILRISDIAVNPKNPDVIYVCLGDFAYLGYSLLTADAVRNTHFGIGLYKSVDGGTNWEPTGLTIEQEKYDYSLLRRVIINPENTDKLVAAGVEGVWTSNDAGVSWTRTLGSMISDIERHPVKPNVLVAGSCYVESLNDGEAGIYKSEDFGSTWSNLPSGIQPKTSGRVDVEFALSNPNYIYAITNGSRGEFNGLYQSVDEGLSWVKKANDSGINIFDWHAGNGKNGQSSYDMVLQVHPLNENIIYAGGVNLWGSVNGGATWNGITYWLNTYGASIHGDLHQMRYNPLDDQIYVVNDGGIARTDSIVIGDWKKAAFDKNYKWPTNWEDLSSGMQITSFYRLGLSEENEKYIIAGAQDNNSFLYNGKTWESLYQGDGMECIVHDTDPNKIWCSSQYGNIGYSSDGGQSFRSLGAISESASWTTPFIYNNSNSTLYAGYGNLYKSINNGEAWTKLSNFPSMPPLGSPATISAMAQCKKEPRSIYLAKRIYHLYNIPSEIWFTTDEGVTWNDISIGLPRSLYYSSLAVDDDDPNLAWLTCSGFMEGWKVYKTTDAGFSWTNISYNLPNIPVNSIVLDESSETHALYVGTDLGVYYTDDTINKWKLVGNNMPNVIVSELEIHYKTKQLYAATFGRGIWKTDLKTSSTRISSTLESPIDCTLFPNPNNGNFYLKFDIHKNTDLKISVISMMGSVVFYQEIANATNQMIVSVYKNLPYGQYFLKVSSPERSVVKKFIVE